jgi:hypothetical protein
VGVYRSTIAAQSRRTHAECPDALHWIYSSTTKVHPDKHHPDPRNGGVNGPPKFDRGFLLRNELLHKHSCQLLRPWGGLAVAPWCLRRKESGQQLEDRHDLMMGLAPHRCCPPWKVSIPTSLIPGCDLLRHHDAQVFWSASGEVRTAYASLYFFSSSHTKKKKKTLV